MIDAAAPPVAVGAKDEVTVTLAGNFEGDRCWSEQGDSLSGLACSDAGLATRDA